MCVNGKMRPVETIPGISEAGDKGEWWRGVNSSMIYLVYYKSFCKCYNVPPPSTIKKVSEQQKEQKKKKN
jgi:hypothetical protein